MAKAASGPLCGANKKAARGGEPCQLRAGQGTDHVGEGRCKYHGGAGSGAPAGNKNAKKHGRYEGIFANALEADELAVMAASEAQGTIAHLKEEIGLLTVRELRMLEVIKGLRAVASGMTVVEETVETLMAEAPGDLPGERALSEMTAAEADAATEADEPITKRKTKRAGTLGQILAAESNLTAVQASKARAIAKLHEMENPEQRIKMTHTGPNGGPVQVEVSDAKQRLAERLARANRGADP